ncbi:MFS transporter [Nocardia arthritidis]|uniref:MFS transporter n=1 Tax=Nocardia arthritidis TaxID=228602 RepID=A0A6G9YGN9_9NOCA|nr:MFS transporter [Nocardia arthritidis]QIS12399.1 MFS transporter [Nocardia arthritidis]
MTNIMIGTRRTPPQTHRAWPALLTMFLGSFSLVTAEFLPPGVLTLIASDLGATEGVVGLSVSATAFTALLAAVGLSAVFPRQDRRSLLLALTLLAVVSNVAVALAPNLAVLLVARLLLGSAIGGFWSMSLVIATQLVPAERVGRAMMIVNAGTTVATVAGVPAGVLLSNSAGWRIVFGVAAVLTVVATVAVRVALPPITPTPGISWAAMGAALRARGVALGLISVVAVIGGHFAGFTYIRPALAERLDAESGVVAILLALFGVGGLIGNFVIGALVDRWLRGLLVVVPAVIGLGIAGVAAGIPVLGYVAAVVWGAAFGGILNVAQLWVTRALPDRVEVAGGLLVAGFQTAIILGSAIGGVGVDGIGLAPTYLVAAAAAIAGGVLLWVSLNRADAAATESA